MQARRRMREECSFIGGCPNVLTPRAAIKPAAACAWLCEHKPTVESPRQDAGKNVPSIIGLPTPRRSGDLVTPGHEDASASAVSQCCKREVAECFFNALDQ